ncbi:MAG TPA: glycosyltransferase family 2 protein [Thermomicrobiales bacterium]|jgi:glycosyltransferase involved in cell wall biosynthesis
MPHSAPLAAQLPARVAYDTPPSPPHTEAVGPILSVIIPCYNEQRTILAILERVQAVSIVKEIIIVDDGSTDGTRELLAALVAGLPGVTVLFHEGNRGKGAAVATGLAHAGGRVVIIQDADLEYDPEEYGAVIAPILAGEAQVVYGSRNLQPNHYSYRLFYWGGRLVTLVTNLLYGSRLTDEATCYKAFALPVIQGLHLESAGFEFCPEVTAKVLRRGYAIREVPISYHARPREEGKKIRASDGLRAIWTLLKYRLMPRVAAGRVVIARREAEIGAEAQV